MSTRHPPTRRRLLLAALLLACALLACQVGPQPATPTPAVGAQAATTATTPTRTLSPTPTTAPTAAPSPTATPCPTSAPRPTSAPTARPTLPPTPSPTATPPLPDAGPLPAPWTAIDLSLPHGSVYRPEAVAYDGAAGLAYVLGRCAPDLDFEDAYQACIAVFDPETDAVRRTVAVPGYEENRIALVGGQLYVHRSWGGAVYTVEAEALARGVAPAPSPVLTDVIRVAADGEGVTYAVSRDEVMRLPPDPLSSPLAALTLDPETDYADTPFDLAATAERVYVLGYQTLRIWSAALAPLAVLDLSDLEPRAMAVDEEGGLLYVGGYEGLVAVDLETQQVTPISLDIEQPLILDMQLDAEGRRLYAIIQPQPDWFGRYAVVAIELDAAAPPSAAQTPSAALHTLYTTLEGPLGGLFLDEEHGRLLLASALDHALIPVDLYPAEGTTRSPLRPGSPLHARIPLGRTVEEVIVDEARGRLYASDSAGWIQVLDRRTYQSVSPGGPLYGGRSISLDGAHRRLYAGDPRVPVVSVFDAGTLALQRTIDASGAPRAGPGENQVVVVNRRFAVYDAVTGRPAGDLQPGVGQPAENCASCYYTVAREAYIDARRGLTATTVYTPRPGKPGDVESIAVDPASGRAYYSLLTGGYVYFSSIALYPDLGALRARAATLTLRGLSGDLALDPAARRLYVAQSRSGLGEGVLYVLDSETLNRLGWVRVAGWAPRVAAVDGELGRLYLPHGGALEVWSRTGGAPPAPLPPEPAVLTRTVAAILPSPDFARDGTLLATIDGRLCRSTDAGQTWQRLRGGLPEFEGYSYWVHAAFSPAYAADATIYAGLYVGEFHGEGVYRSTDGGDTWQLSSDGLYDLRVERIVPSPDYAYDRTVLAYARIPTGGAVYRSDDAGGSWQPVVRQLSYGTPPLPEPEELLPGAYDSGVSANGVSAAPYPPRYRCSYDGLCERSVDAGGSWERVDTGAFQMRELTGQALSPHYSEDGLVYWLTQNALIRYDERAGSGAICVDPRMGGPRDYTNGFLSLAAAVDAKGEVVLFVGSSAGEFVRLAAGEVPWERAWPLPPADGHPVSAPTPTPTVTPCPEAFQIDERLAPTEAQLPPRLGCATGPAGETAAAWQPFERGAMIWRQDEARIYVLDQRGTWAAYDDTWQVGQPEKDPALVPPEGLVQPVRGFGRVWRERLGGAAAEIGWAAAPEGAFAMLWQPFANGLLLRDGEGQILVLYDDGTWNK